MISRVRIEASAKSENEVRDDLASAVALVQETFGGEWNYDSPEEVIAAKSGFWGRASIKRKVE